MEPREPDWNAIVNAPITESEYHPWLSQLIEGAAVEALNATDPAQTAEWRGYHKALLLIRDFPAAEVKRQLEAVETARKEEEERNARQSRVRSGFGWLRRVPGFGRRG